VARRRPAQVRFGIDGFDTGNPHQPLDSLAIHSQHYGHAPAAEEWKLEIQLVEFPEQPQVLGALPPRLVIVRGSRQRQQFALPLNAQRQMSWVDPFPAILNRAGQLFF
jgi:hypothetical protein